MPQIPNLFMIGAPKTGSTALAEILNLHPEIYKAIEEIKDIMI